MAQFKESNIKKICRLYSEIFKIKLRYLLLLTFDVSIINVVQSIIKFHVMYRRVYCIKYITLKNKTSIVIINKNK